MYESHSPAIRGDSQIPNILHQMIHAQPGGLCLPINGIMYPKQFPPTGIANLRLFQELHDLQLVNIRETNVLT